ncbi:hypothetical protein D3C87_103270 [compost metagenome]
MSQYDVPSLYSFLLHTPEAGLRKMLVDNKPFTEAHFNFLLKIVRGCDEAKFTECFDKCEYPKIKMGPKEVALKEKFWADAVTTFNSRGLLTPAMPTKVAA